MINPFVYDIYDYKHTVCFINIYINVKRIINKGNITFVRIKMKVLSTENQVFLIDFHLAISSHFKFLFNA
jgi:hypothetical protein